MSQLTVHRQLEDVMVGKGQPYLSRCPNFLTFERSIMSFFPEPGVIQADLTDSNVRAQMLEMLNALIEKVSRDDCDIVALMVAGVHDNGMFLGATAIQDGLPLRQVSESLQLLNNTIMDANLQLASDAEQH